jgi:hypothetical protein
VSGSLRIYVSKDELERACLEYLAATDTPMLHHSVSYTGMYAALRSLLQARSDVSPPGDSERMTEIP